MNPTISIVIPVRDNHEQLRHCLDGLWANKARVDCEVVVIDDGSREPVSFEWQADDLFPCKVVRQVPLGVSAARNTGIAHSTGEVILFVDSDVVIGPEFIDSLATSVEENPEDVAFQAALVGGRANLVERMEGLRLKSTLEVLSCEGGHVYYANTSAFAIRRSFIDPNRDLFDPAAVRGEDSQLLAKLLSCGKPPRIVPEARAVHRPRASLPKYISKHFWIGYYTAPAREKLQIRCPGVLLHPNDRRRILKKMLGLADGNLTEILAVLLVAAAHSLERIGRIICRLIGLRPGRSTIFSVPVNCVRESELVARILSNSTHRRGAKITYLNAWTLVQSKTVPNFLKLLGDFDVCYPDGMGAVWCSVLMNRRRLHKVTANNFIFTIMQQFASEGLPIAMVGADEVELNIAVKRIKNRFPELNIVGISHGYFSNTEEVELRNRLREWQPRLVVVGMGQPFQEQWTSRTFDLLSDVVFLCVGGLFDYISGAKPTPPRWIRKSGWEWLFILVRRPRRYWRRYVFGIPMLLMMLMSELVSKLYPNAKKKPSVCK